MKLVFEVASIADSVRKAAGIAPTKAGKAFDKASGLLISSETQFMPDAGQEVHTVELRSTNLDIFYSEIVEVVKIEGEGKWRLSSITLNAILSKLKIGTGKLVTMEDEDDTNNVLISAGRMRAKLRKMDVSYFPEWAPFSPDLLEMVPDIASRIQQAEWAANPSAEPPMSGLHLNGTHIAATDRYRLCRVPCEAEPLFRPITVPAGVLSTVLSATKAPDIAIGIDENEFLMMPDPVTQIRTVIFDVAYPDLEQAINKVNLPDQIKLKKQAVLDMIELAGVFGQNERIPRLTVFIGDEEFAVMMSDREEGLLGDVIELPGQCVHDRVKIFFTPKNITQALIAAPSEEVILYYDKDKPGRIRLDGGSGFEAVVMPRRETED